MLCRGCQASTYSVVILGPLLSLTNYDGGMRFWGTGPVGVRGRVVQSTCSLFSLSAGCCPGASQPVGLRLPLLSLHPFARAPRPHLGPCEVCMRPSLWAPRGLAAFQRLISLQGSYSRGRDPPESSPTHWSTSGTAAARAGPGWSWKLPPGALRGSRGSSAEAALCCLPGALAGSWIRSGTAGTQTGARTAGRCHRSLFSRLCPVLVPVGSSCAASPSPGKF